jgi:hypothetical protein
MKERQTFLMDLCAKRGNSPLGLNNIMWKTSCQNFKVFDKLTWAKLSIQNTTIYLLIAML